MATTSFHRLIMGRVEIDNFCYIVIDDILNLFYRNVLSSPPCFIRPFSMWPSRQGDKKWYFFIFFFSETIRMMKLKLGILALDITLYKSCVSMPKTLKELGAYCLQLVRPFVHPFVCPSVQKKLKLGF